MSGATIGGWLVTLLGYWGFAWWLLRRSRRRVALVAPATPATPETHLSRPHLSRRLGQGLVCSACGRPTIVRSGVRFECEESPEGELAQAMAIERSALHPDVRQWRIQHLREMLAEARTDENLKSGVIVGNLDALQGELEELERADKGAT